MSYLRLLKLVDRLFARLLKHADHDKAWWAWVAYYHGRVALLQIDYVDRVKKLGGWEPVEVHGYRPWLHHITPIYPPFTTTTGANTTVRYTYPAP